MGFEKSAALHGIANALPVAYIMGTDKESKDGQRARSRLLALPDIRHVVRFLLTDPTFETYDTDPASLGVLVSSPCGHQWR